MNHHMINDHPSAMAHRKVVSLEAATEVHYWVSAFESSPSELRRAIKQVGNSVAAVRSHLAKSGDTVSGVANHPR